MKERLKAEVLGEVIEGGMQGLVKSAFDEVMNVTSFLIVGQKKQVGVRVDRPLVWWQEYKGL